jgi:hypothetical protein
MSGSAQRYAAELVCSDGIDLVRLTWAGGLEITGELARSAMDLVDSLNTNRHRPLLVEMTGTAGVTWAARTIFARDCTVSQLALLGRTPVDRVLANSTLGASAPRMPTQFFTSEDAALAWLRDREAMSSW